MWSLFRPLTRHVSRHLEPWLTGLRVMRGIPVRASFDRNHDFATVFEGVEHALTLIAERHPVWIRRMQRNVAQIWVYRHPMCRGKYIHDIRAIVLDSYFVSTFTPPEVASCIVHEATHARIAACVKGMRYAEHRAKHERICRRAEVRFGQRLPEAQGRPIIERARAAIECSDEELAPAIDHVEVWRITQLSRIQESAAPEWLKQHRIRQVDRRYSQTRGSTN